MPAPADTFAKQLLNNASEWIASKEVLSVVLTTVKVLDVIPERKLTYDWSISEKLYTEQIFEESQISFITMEPDMIMTFHESGCSRTVVTGLCCSVN